MTTQKISSTPNFVSQISWKYRALFIVAALFGGLLSYQLLIMANINGPFNLITFIMGLISFSGMIWCITGYWRFFSKLSFYKDRLEINCFFGTIHRTIYLKHIKGCRISYFSGQYGNEQWLTVYTLTRRFVVYPWAYQNFSRISDRLTRGRPLIDESAEETSNRMVKGVMLLLTLVFISLTVHIYFGQATNQPTTAGELVTKVYTMADKPQIMKGNKGSKWLQLSVNELPGHEFIVGKLAYEKMPIRTDIFRGDTVLLTLSRVDDQKYILKEKPLTFFDKYVHNNRLIDVYGLQTHDRVYVPVEVYLGHIRQNNWGVMALLLVGTLFCMGYYRYLSVKKKVHNPFT